MSSWAECGHNLGQNILGVILFGQNVDLVLYVPHIILPKHSAHGHSAQNFPPTGGSPLSELVGRIILSQKFPDFWLSLFRTEKSRNDPSSRLFRGGSNDYETSSPRALTHFGQI